MKPDPELRQMEPPPPLPPACEASVSRREMRVFAEFSNFDRLRIGASPYFFRSPQFARGQNSANIPLSTGNACFAGYLPPSPCKECPPVAMTVPRGRIRPAQTSVSTRWKLAATSRCSSWWWTARNCWSGKGTCVWNYTALTSSEHSVYQSMFNYLKS